MPATYRFDLPNRLVFSRAWGVLTGEEIKAHSRRLPTDPRFDPGFRQLQVYIDVEALSISDDDLRHIAGLNPWGAGARRAVVVTTPLQFALARQHEMLRVQAADEIQIFRDLPSALAWLGLPPGWRPPPPSPDDPVFEFPEPGR